MPENLILWNTGEYPVTARLGEPIISELLEREQHKQVRKAVKEFVRALRQHEEVEIANGILAFMRSWEHALPMIPED